MNNGFQSLFSLASQCSGRVPNSVIFTGADADGVPIRKSKSVLSKAVALLASSSSSNNSSGRSDAGSTAAQNILARWIAESALRHVREHHDGGWEIVWLSCTLLRRIESFQADLTESSAGQELVLCSRTLRNIRDGLQAELFDHPEIFSIAWKTSARDVYALAESSLRLENRFSHDAIRRLASTLVDAMTACMSHDGNLFPGHVRFIAEHADCPVFDSPTAINTIQELQECSLFKGTVAVPYSCLHLPIPHLTEFGEKVVDGLTLLFSCSIGIERAANESGDDTRHFDSCLAHITRLVRFVERFQIKLVASQRTIDSSVKEVLARANVCLLERLSIDHVDHMHACLGGQMLHSLEQLPILPQSMCETHSQLMEACLNLCGRVRRIDARPTTIGYRPLWAFVCGETERTDTRKPTPSVVILRCINSSDASLLRDACESTLRLLCNVSGGLQHTCVGGGAFECFVAEYLHHRAVFSCWGASAQHAGSSATNSGSKKARRVAKYVARAVRETLHAYAEFISSPSRSGSPASEWQKVNFFHVATTALKRVPRTCEPPPTLHHEHPKSTTISPENAESRLKDPTHLRAVVDVFECKAALLWTVLDTCSTVVRTHRGDVIRYTVDSMPTL